MTSCACCTSTAHREAAARLAVTRRVGHRSMSSKENDHPGVRDDGLAGDHGLTRPVTLAATRRAAG